MLQLYIKQENMHKVYFAYAFFLFLAPFFSLLAYISMHVVTLSWDVKALRCPSPCVWIYMENDTVNSDNYASV